MAARTNSWHRVPLEGQPGGPRVGDAGRSVGLHDGRGGRQSRADPFGAPAPAGKEVRLDESRHDATIGGHIATVEEDGHPVDAAHLEMLVVVGPVLVDPVPVDDGGTHQGHQLLVGGRPVGAGGAEQVHAARTDPGPLQLVEQRWQDGGVRHGAGQIGEDDGHPIGSGHQAAERRAGERRAERRAHGSGLVGQRGRARRLDDHRVVRELDGEAVLPEGQRHPHRGPRP